MSKKLIFILTLFVMILAACSPKPKLGLEANSDKSRITDPQVADADLVSLVQGNTQFAFDLYRQLGQGQTGNFFYSPYSISLALAMTYAGAVGNTAQQMAATMNFTLPPAQFHPAFNKLALELASRSEIQDIPADQQFKLNVANSLWGQQEQGFLPEFLDNLAENYGAGMHTVDFTADPDSIRKSINDWVAQQTADKIKDLIPQGAIDTLTRLVLANAIYFNASWESPFETSQTKPGDFLLQDQNVIQAPVMHQSESLGYMYGDGYEAVSIPYVGYQISMLIIQPDFDQFGSVESQLSPDFINAIENNLQHSEVIFSMPKFKFDSSFELNAALDAMGMKDAFSAGTADFSAMDGAKDLFISAVIHKAFVSVDEAGTEAAAATAVIMAASAMPMQPVTIDINRPFIFMIRDDPTGSILFVGRVMNPLE